LEYYEVNGKMEGSWNEFYPSGVKKIETFFKNGKQEGETNIYFENNRLYKKIFFKDGTQQDSMFIYYPNGKIMERSFIKDGKKNGKFYYFYENGSKKASGEFKEGELEGDYIIFNNNGDSTNSIKFNKSKPINWSYLKNSKLPYRLIFPNEWTVIDNINESNFTLVDSKRNSKYKANLNIIPLTVNNGTPTNTVIDNNLKDLQEAFLSFKLIAKNHYQAEYTIRHDEFDIRINSKVIICKKQYFLLSCMTSLEEYDIYEPIFDLISGSFECKK
jgi:hypothetical protein